MSREDLSSQDIMDAFLELRTDVISCFKTAAQKYKQHVSETVTDTRTKMQLLLDNYKNQGNEGHAQLKQIHEQAINNIKEYTEELIQMVNNAWDVSVERIHKLYASFQKSARIVRTMIKKVHDEVMESLSRQIQSLTHEIRSYSNEMCQKQTVAFQIFEQELKN